MDKQVQDKLNIFFTKFKYVNYKKGEILIRAGDEPSGIFFLKKGIVKKYTISFKGEEVIINLFKPISFFPMSWAIHNHPNEYFYEALTELEIYKAPQKDVVDFVQKEPDVMFDLLSRVYKGTYGLEKRLAYLMAGSAYSRLINEIIIYSQRFGVRDGKIITLKLTEKDLAAQTGMARETVSREIKHLKDKKLLIFQKDVFIIPNFEKLEEEIVGF